MDGGKKSSNRMKRARFRNETKRKGRYSNLKASAIRPESFRSANGGKLKDKCQATKTTH